MQDIAKLKALCQYSLIYHQRRYDMRASIRLIASAIVGVIMPRLSAHAQRYCRGK